MFCKEFVATALVLGLCTTCFGQVKLERKVLEGTSHTVETNTKVNQTLTIAGMDVESKSETHAKLKSTAGKRDADGKLPVREKIESLQISTGVMGMNYDFDSANPDAKGDSPLEMLRDVHKALSQRVSTTIYDKDNHVEAVQLDKDIVGGLPVEVQKLVKSQLDPEAMKKEANERLDQLPSEPVKQGDTWQRTTTANFGAGQVMTFLTELKYEGPVEKDGKKLDKITTKTLKVDFALQDSPLPFTLKSSDLKPEDCKGEILFDRELGRAVETTSTLHVTGDITFVANGADLPAKLDLKMETTTTAK
jgi:hypothetical protein